MPPPPPEQASVPWPVPPPHPGPDPTPATPLYQAQIDELKARWRDDATDRAERDKRREARADSQVERDEALRVALHAAYIDVAKGIVDRSITRANFVTAAAGTLGASYAALLALAYSTAHPPTPWAIAPALFYGLAFSLSAYYVAFIRTSSKPRDILNGTTRIVGQEQRLVAFVDWMNDSAMHRAWALRGAVVSLGIGVALTPLAFLTLAGAVAALLVAAGVALLAAALAAERVRSPERTAPP